MWTAETVAHELRLRGDLWMSGPGLVGLRGSTLGLFEALEGRIAETARAATGEEWRGPAALSWDTLGRSDYFASFPQWLTAASHLSDDASTLERVALADDPAEAARRAQAPARAALPPAICYHVYEALADSIVDSPRTVTLVGTCWRHEVAGFRPLERGWAFTMREVVCVGSKDDTQAFLERMTRASIGLAIDLGLSTSLQAATDPFFAPTGRGKALLQQIKGLKKELVLPLGDGRGVAAASFNAHDTYFGDAFGIYLGDGSVARTACAAYGLERWLLAFLVAHGPNPANWPESIMAHTDRVIR